MLTSDFKVPWRFGYLTSTFSSCNWCVGRVEEKLHFTALLFWYIIIHSHCCYHAGKPLKILRQDMLNGDFLPLYKLFTEFTLSDAHWTLAGWHYQWKCVRVNVCKRFFFLRVLQPLEKKKTKPKIYRAIHSGSPWKYYFQCQPQLLPVSVSDHLSRLFSPPQLLLLNSLPTFSFSIPPPTHLTCWKGNFPLMSPHPWSFFRAAVEGVQLHQLGPQILVGVSFRAERGF